MHTTTANGTGRPVGGTAIPRVLLSVEAAADRLSISRTRMYALIKAGAVITVRVGRLRRVPVIELDAFAARLVAAQHPA
jgi:excisionase family DNA binding protein